VEAPVLSESQLWGGPAESGPDDDPPAPTRADRVARSADCPFLRLELDGALVDPDPEPSDRHRCVAINGPRVLSFQQQELVCLRAAHVDCPRYRRRVGGPAAVQRGPIRTPPIPRAIAASLVVLALAAGISFGFVVQRGGIDLPASGTPSSAEAAVSGGPTAVPPTAGASAAVTPGASVSPSEAPTAPPTPAGLPTPTPASTVEPSALPSASPGASGVPSASRLAVLTPCPGQAGCYVYTVRSGDNLFSIAHWFGVPLDTIYAWNPAAKHGIRPGEQLKIPTPTR
jgi:LysM repeat protein